MLDESISASPTSSESKLFFKKRLERKIQRKSLQNNKSFNNDVTGNKTTEAQDGTFTQELEDVCESDIEQNLNRTFKVFQPRFYGPNYDPFESQQMLAVADRLNCAQALKTNIDQKKSLHPTHGFYKCAELTLDDRNERNDQHIAKVSHVANTQCEITDTELVHLCEEVEQEIVGMKTHSQQEHQVKKSIVESILDDFCQSLPSSQEDVEYIDEINRSPFFRFRHQKLRTYARKRRLVDIVEQHFDYQSSEDHDINDTLSELSVQEDFTEPQTTHVGDVDLHNSRLCENLLNLSAYFTQHSNSKKNSSTSELYSTARNLDTTADIIDIIDLKINSIEKLRASNRTLRELYSYRYVGFTDDSSDDFQGFSDDECHCINLPDLSNVSVAVLSQRVNFNGCKNNEEMLLKHAFTLEADDDSTVVANIEIQPATVLKDVVEHNADNESKSLDILWKEDSDFFANFNTQENFIEAANDKNGKAGLQAASQNPLNTANNGFKKINEKVLFENMHKNGAAISDSKATHQVVNDSKPLKEEKCIDQSDDEWNDDCEFFANFKTQEFLPQQSCKNSAARKTITHSVEEQQRSNDISNETQQKTGSILEQLADIKSLHPSIKRNELNAEILDSEVSTPNQITNAFVGFRTASSKTIKISKEAEKRAAAILQTLPEIDGISYDGNDEYLSNCQKQACDRLKPELDDKPSTSKQIDREATHTVAVSLDPYMKENHDFENIQFSEWIPMESSEQKVQLIQPELIGFRTAGSKVINISDAAKKKAAFILSELPEIPVKKTSFAMNEMNTKENETVCEIQPKEDHAVGVCSFTKRKSELDIVRPSKLLCRSNSAGSMNSPHTPKVNENLKISSTQISVRSPSSVSQVITPTVISRSNLLSLSKRRRNKSRLISDSVDKSRSAMDTETPIKQFTSNIINSNTPKSDSFSLAIARTSTPRPVLVQSTSSLDVENDFQKIKWENCNDSVPNANCSNLSNSSCANISQTHQGPSPKQRIERLSIYGTPPAISPICISRRTICRPQGLSRSRSKSSKSNQ